MKLRVVFIILVLMASTLLSYSQNPYLILGEKYAAQNNYDAAISYFKKSLELSNKNINKEELYITYDRLTNFYSCKQQRDSCWYYFEKALMLGKTLSDFDYTTILASLSFSLSNVGFDKKSLQLSEERIEILKSRYGHDSPRLVPEYQRIAWDYRDAGFYGKAVEYAKIVEELAYKTKDSDEEFPFKRSYNESFVSTICIIQECDNAISGIHYILECLDKHKDALIKDNIDNALSIVFTLSLENDFKEGCLSVYKYRTLYGSYKERLENLICLRVEGKNLKYDVHAEEYSQKLYELVMEGNYSIYFTEEETEHLLSILPRYYIEIENNRKAYETSKKEYEWRRNNNKEVLYAELRIITTGSRLNSELNYVIDFANNILASHKYDNNASVTDLIKFKIFESYCRLGDKEEALKSLKCLGERNDYESLREICCGLYYLNDMKSLLPFAKRVYEYEGDGVPEGNKEYDLLVLLIAAKAENDIKTLNRYGKDYVKLYRDCYIQDVLSLTGEEKENYIKDSAFSYELAADFFIGINSDGKLWSLPKEAYNYLLLRKGMLLTNEIQHRKIIRSCNDTVKERLINDYYGIKYRDQNNNFSLRTEVIRRDLLRASSNNNIVLSSINYTWEDVRNSLKKDEVAIEFLVSDPLDTKDEAAYVALVLRHDYIEPIVVLLSPFFNLTGFDSNEHIEVHNDLTYNYIWKPLLPYINDAKTIYFSPTSFLNHLPIEYVSDGNTRVCDTWNLIRVSSTREIIERNPHDRKNHAILFGGLDFDLNKDDMIEESRKYSIKRDHINRSTDSDDVLRDKIKYLPCSLTEVNDIAALFSDTPTIISGKAGTEESFKALNGTTADILHIATHSFYPPDKDLKLSTDNDEFSRGEKAMSSSGLLFSGAKNTLERVSLPEEVEDGIVTARELSNLNLSNVDLAVVSACSSGTGEMTSEGIYGLQRGFKLAGVKSLIMSLWKVDDAATCMLMTEFYKHYLKGETKRESLQAAQAALRKSDEFSEPMYWAGIILLDGLD